MSVARRTHGKSGIKKGGRIRQHTHTQAERQEEKGKGESNVDKVLEAEDYLPVRRSYFRPWR